jgi:uncharacterized membrane protein
VRPGRLALVLTTSAYVVVLVWSALVLPDRVPAHFDAGGQADDWASRTATIVFWVVMGLVVLVAMPALTRLAVSGDGTWVNMPRRSKEYWFAPERRAEFRVRFGDDLEGFAALTGVLMTGALVLTTWVATTGRDGAPWWAFAVPTAAYVVATVVWTVRLLRAYRPPDPP